MTTKVFRVNSTNAVQNGMHIYQHSDTDTRRFLNGAPLGGSAAYLPRAERDLVEVESIPVTGTDYIGLAVGFTPDGAAVTMDFHSGTRNQMVVLRSDRIPNAQEHIATAALAGERVFPLTKMDGTRFGCPGDSPVRYPVLVPTWRGVSQQFGHGSGRVPQRHWQRHYVDRDRSADWPYGGMPMFRDGNSGYWLDGTRANDVITRFGTHEGAYPSAMESWEALRRHVHEGLRAVVVDAGTDTVAILQRVATYRWVVLEVVYHPAAPDSDQTVNLGMFTPGRSFHEDDVRSVYGWTLGGADIALPWHHGLSNRPGHPADEQRDATRTRATLPTNGTSFDTETADVDPEAERLRAEIARLQTELAEAQAAPDTLRQQFTRAAQIALSRNGRSYGPGVAEIAEETELDLKVPTWEWDVLVRVKMKGSRFGARADASFIQNSLSVSESDSEVEITLDSDWLEPHTEIVDSEIDRVENITEVPFDEQPSADLDALRDY